MEIFLISCREKSMSNLVLADFLVEERGFVSFRAVGLLLPASLKFNSLSSTRLGGCTAAFLPSFFGDADRGMNRDGGAVRPDDVDSGVDNAVPDLRGNALSELGLDNAPEDPWTPLSS